jgi:hypothetical protein
MFSPRKTLLRNITVDDIRENKWKTTWGALEKLEKHLKNEAVNPTRCGEVPIGGKIVTMHKGHFCPCQRKGTPRKRESFTILQLGEFHYA